jgi:hypothetical protein
MDGTASQATGRNQMDQFHHLAKVRVAGSNPVFRSKPPGGGHFSTLTGPDRHPLPDAACVRQCDCLKLHVTAVPFRWTSFVVALSDSDASRMVMSCPAGSVLLWIDPDGGSEGVSERVPDSDTARAEFGGILSASTEMPFCGPPSFVRRGASRNELFLCERVLESLPLDVAVGDT